MSNPTIIQDFITLSTPAIFTRVIFFRISQVLFFWFLFLSHYTTPRHGVGVGLMSDIRWCRNCGVWRTLCKKSNFDKTNHISALRHFFIFGILAYGPAPQIPPRFPPQKDSPRAAPRTENSPHLHACCCPERSLPEEDKKSYLRTRTFFS